MTEWVSSEIASRTAAISSLIRQRGIYSFAPARIAFAAALASISNTAGDQWYGDAFLRQHAGEFRDILMHFDGITSAPWPRRAFCGALDIADLRHFGAALTRDAAGRSLSTQVTYDQQTHTSLFLVPVDLRPTSYFSGLIISVICADLVLDHHHLAAGDQAID